MLQLQLASCPSSLPSIEVLPSIGTGPTVLRPQEVLRFVIAGVAAANAELQTEYYLGKVRFVENDSGPESIYQQLATFIVKHVVHG